MINQHLLFLSLVSVIALALPPGHVGWEDPAAGPAAEAPQTLSHSQTQLGHLESALVGPPAGLAVQPPGAPAAGPPGADDASGDTSSPEGARPLPFDPLSPEEKLRAIDVALRDGSLPDRHQVLGAALHTQKAFLALDAWPRMAEVWIYDYTTDTTRQLLVDLDRGAVASVVLLDVEPPLAAAELRRAGEMALGDGRALQRLADLGVPRDGLEWTGRLWSDPALPVPCPEHRCVLVAMLEGDRFVFDPLVLVDLSAGRVVGLLDAQYRWIDEAPGVAP